MNRRDAIKQTALILGYTVSASSIAGLMQGCQATETRNWTPKVLTPQEGNLLKAVTELIMPATETSFGANDVYVHEFIDLMMDGHLEPEEIDVLKAGMVNLESAATSVSAGDKSFVQLEAAQQNDILSSYANTAKEDMRAAKGEPVFWPKLMELTLLGYFSSERVGEEMLAYDPIPGQYNGCMPLEENGGLIWSL
ncbi:MAG: gluconate 2-dehydrogenase subunit 3 family protein [Bacteroidota bacterium]